jgi:acyl carrier protein
MIANQGSHVPSLDVKLRRERSFEALKICHVPQTEGSVARMTPEAIYVRLTEILRDVFEDETLVAAPDLTADQVDGWDSFAHVRLMLTVERAFHIEFAASEIGELANVGELAALVRAHVP